MTSIGNVPLPTLPTQPFRLDVPLHELLQHATREPFPPLANGPVSLPEPVFPEHPELIHELDSADIAAHETVVRTGTRHWPADRILQTMRGWMTPYFKSRILPGEFQPIIAYLFTEWKCNLDCHYCWSYDLLDWLIDKQRQGWKMVDSIPRLQNMKSFMRGKGEEWGCRAGQHWVIVRTDGTLAPCLPMYNAKYDWGTAENQKFDKQQLLDMKKGCEPNCFSTLGYNVAYCYSMARVVKWLVKQAMHGFQGVTGSFE